MSELHEKLHVLLLDDNRNFLSILRAVLRDVGIRNVAEYVSPTEALKYLEHASVNIAFVDLVMPEMNGFEFADRVRHSSETANPFMPIVMITGHADRAIVGQAINHGIDELLVKPLRPRHLHERLNAVISKPRRYIRTKSGYFGPDRRRRQDPEYRGPERRLEESGQTIKHPGVGGQIFSMKRLPATRAESRSDGIMIID
ncbi:MAG: response regulator [Hyphomicrobiales bacterium]